uniref:Chromosome 9 open reading frame 85 n=1 Tax=Ovis aries TaxID=9940 RepID=A0AC11DWG6_SHEEP
FLKTRIKLSSLTSLEFTFSSLPKYSKNKKINAKLHDGVCQRCKEVLEWRVKYSKYKPLSKPKKCVKCLQKTVKDSYHIMCRPCACELEVCAKCGKREDIVIPFNKEPEKTENVENNLCSSHRSCRRNEENDDDLDFDIDLEDAEEEDK